MPFFVSQWFSEWDILLSLLPSIFSWDAQEGMRKEGSKDTQAGDGSFQDLWSVLYKD